MMRVSVGWYGNSPLNLERLSGEAIKILGLATLNPLQGLTLAYVGKTPKFPKPIGDILSLSTSKRVSAGGSNLEFDPLKK